MQINSLYYRFRVFKIKLLNWEYWPMYVVYFPVGFYYLYLSLKAKSPFFFSASNPSIETGGMFFESKWEIFKLIPQQYFPKTILIEASSTIEKIGLQITKAAIEFPVIAKPDRGERGWCVEKINTKEELEIYRQKMNVDFLIQQYVDYPVELSVFYYRNPRHEKGTVTSFTFKKLLSVVGDGNSTIEELIIQSDRCFLQLPNLVKNMDIDFKKVLKNGEEQVLVPYGNHVRGAMFLNYNSLIDNSLIDVFDKISKDIKGFYFGRFDLRTTSIEDLKAGKNIAILELNGAGAEPAHIYQPNFSFMQAQKDIAKHYKMMFDAAIENRKNGISFMTYKDFKNTQKLEKQYKNKVKHT